PGGGFGESSRDDQAKSPASGEAAAEQPAWGAPWESPANENPPPAYPPPAYPPPGYAPEYPATSPPPYPAHYPPPIPPPPRPPPPAGLRRRAVSAAAAVRTATTRLRSGRQPGCLPARLRPDAGLSGGIRVRAARHQHDGDRLADLLVPGPAVLHRFDRGHRAG